MPDFSKQRKQMVDRYRKIGYISSEAMASAVCSVPREQFMNPDYKDYAYLDQPFPIPGDGRQTISAPYMYPIFYEPLKLKLGDSVLEVGAGSGYGAALSKELVGKEGTVVSIEINPITYQFARENLGMILPVEFTELVVMNLKNKFPASGWRMHTLSIVCVSTGARRFI